MESVSSFSGDLICSDSRRWVGKEARRSDSGDEEVAVGGGETAVVVEAVAEVAVSRRWTLARR